LLEFVNMKGETRVQTDLRKDDGDSDGNGADDEVLVRRGYVTWVVDWGLLTRNIGTFRL
jgi:hypothetical protein